MNMVGLYFTTVPQFPESSVLFVLIVGKMREGSCTCRTSNVVVDLFGLTWILNIPLSVQLCMGWLEFGRKGRLDVRENVNLKTKSTQSDGTPCIYQ